MMPQHVEPTTPRRTPPNWLLGITAAWLLVGLGPLAFGPVRALLAGPAGTTFWFIKSATECLVFLWAARRVALGPRLRQALRLTAGAYSLSAVLAVPDVLGSLQLAPLPPAPFQYVGTFLTYAFGLAGILWMPMFPARRTASLTFLLDLAASVLGLGSVLAVLVTMPQLRAEHGVGGGLLVTYGGAQTLMLVAVNALILRGIARPSARAFWLLVAGLFGNLLVVTLAQFPGVDDAVTVAMILTSLCSLWAAESYAHDPVAAVDAPPVPSWMTTFNPLPILATGGIALLLLAVSFDPDPTRLRLLTVAVVLQVAVLLTRLLLTAHENARLLQEDAERDRRLNDIKMAAVGRLAGGIAHWFNNLLTTVIGHAEMGASAARGEASVSDDFARIKDAADHAAALTNQLLSFSGRQFLAPVRLDVGEVLERFAAAAAARLPAGVVLVVDPATDGGLPAQSLLVRADRKHLEAVLRELVSNASDAMPRGGTIRIGPGISSLSVGLANATLSVGPGRYVTVTVQDAGVGASPEVVASMFDPFFSTKPPYASAGLGLAAVYGVVAAHHGGLVVDSAPGNGTRVTIYLPALPDAEAAPVYARV